jgi:transcriptional regulator GlxA family with amidase domain
MPPHQFIMENRTKEACRLLAFSDQSIEEIANRTGFANRHHFSRAFARRMNRGPAAYRGKCNKR